MISHAFRLARFDWATASSMARSLVCLALVWAVLAIVPAIQLGRLYFASRLPCRRWTTQKLFLALLLLLAMLRFAFFATLPLTTATSSSIDVTDLCRSYLIIVDDFSRLFFAYVAHLSFS